MSNLVIPDGGNIGSASDTDAISIASSGNVTLSQTLDGGAIGSAVTMSANQACVKTAINASGSAPIYACRAWACFKGDGTVGIHASGNVSSITDNGTGDYTANFTTAMPDINYSVAGASAGTINSDACDISGIGGTTQYKSTSSIRFSYRYIPSASLTDRDHINIQIFR